MPSPTHEGRSSVSRASQAQPNSASGLRTPPSETSTLTLQYRPLLPKTSASTSTKSNSQRSGRLIGLSVVRNATCAVPHCTRSPCPLTSHQYYTRIRRQTAWAANLSQESSLESKSSSDTNSDNADTVSPSLRGLSPSQQVFDSLPKLPFSEPSPPEFRAILHYFATSLFQRSILVYRAPMDTDAFLKRTLALFSTNETFALACIALTKCDMLMTSRSQTPDAISVTIYSRLTRTLRKKLDDIPNADVDDLLMFILALSNFDIVWKRIDAIPVHQQGIKHLVSARGGIHNLGRSLPYLLPAERRLAMLTGTRPLFLVRDPSALQQPEPPLGSYGEAFYTKEINEVIVEDVCRFCRDACRLIDLFETNKICFDVNNRNSTNLAAMPYFFYSRDRLNGEFSILNAEHFASKSQSYCVLLAANLVAYPIVYGNIVPINTTFMAENLQAILEKQNLVQNWALSVDLLLWLLIVLATTPVSSLNQTWIVNAIKNQLILRFEGSAWPPCRRHELLQILRQFVWSTDHLQQPFDKLCIDLSADPGSRARRNSLHDQHS